MKSQSFDDWILADDPLKPEQEAALQKAISTSASGVDQTPLVQSFQQVEYILHSTPMAAPNAGFSSRWQMRLAEKKARQQRLMIGLGALLALGAGSIIALAVFLPQIETISIAQLTTGLISNLVMLIARVYQLRQLAAYALSSLPPAVPIALWVGLATSLSLFTLAWVYILWHIIVPKGMKA